MSVICSATGESALRLGCIGLERLMTCKRLLSVALTSAFLLGGCGIKGDLETPPPIWGDKSNKTQPVTPNTDS
jgi:predicted small lipoprotein YifL